MDKISNAEIVKAMKEYEEGQGQTARDFSDNGSFRDKDGDEKPGIASSIEYKQFVYENRPAIHTWYEKACMLAGKVMRINPGKNEREGMKEALDSCHFNIEPEDAFSFSIIGPLLFILVGLILTVLLLKADIMFICFVLLAGVGIILPLTRLPYIFAGVERLKASKEIILCIFYIVTYMRQNSNLEKAVGFAAEHLSGPLAIDLRKVLWDVESEKYDNIKESLDTYLARWRKTNMEFIETMNLIESSLYESRDEARIDLLDKALDVILTETYEKMLHYTHEIQSPINTLHMLGIILPILGLVILPLVVVFMENVSWIHIALLYNIVIPVSVYFVGKKILSTRPGGYGTSDISESAAVLFKDKKEKTFLGIKLTPPLIGCSTAALLILIGLLPLIVHQAIGGGGNDITIGKNQYDPNSGLKLLEYRASKTMLSTNSTGQEAPVYKGPYGLVAGLFSIFVVLGAGLGIGLYYKYKTKDLMKIREHTIKLEEEFGSAVFQLGNRLGDGIPLEMCFSKVAQVLGDSEPGHFFDLIDQNIRRLGMSVDEAMFDPKAGALVSFPSSLIKSSMKVLSESIKKGPYIAARAMTNIARYVKEMHSVEERLNDLLAEVISSMNSLVRFLAPVISGIVVGITSMITAIIGSLSVALSKFSEGADQSALSGLTSMFSDGMPTYYFQIVVGLYIVQIVFLVSQTLSGIRNGDDKLGEEHTIGVYMISSILLYAAITAIVMIIFNTIAISILGGIVNAEVT